MVRSGLCCNQRCVKKILKETVLSSCYCLHSCTNTELLTVYVNAVEYRAERVCGYRGITEYLFLIISTIYYCGRAMQGYYLSTRQLEASFTDKC